jgi:hypothetical protein
MSISLYDIEHKRLELFDALTGDDEAAAARAKDELAAIEEVRDDKLAGCCGHLKNLESDVEAIQTEIVKLNDKLSAALKRADKFRDYIKFCIGEGSKWKNGVHSISWRKSEAVEIPDDEKVPSQYMRVTVTESPDRAAIKLDLRNGLQVDWAKIVERQSLQVK